MWKCKECGKLYKQKGKMKEHIKTHYLNQRGDSIKVEDEVLVDDPIAPEESILEYTGEEEKNEVLRLEISTRLEEFRDPEKGKMWKCTECGKIRKGKYKLECHVQTHLKQFDNFVSCCISLCILWCN